MTSTKLFLGVISLWAFSFVSAIWFIGEYSPMSLVIMIPYFFITANLGEQNFYINLFIATLPTPVIFYFLIQYSLATTKLVPKHSLIIFGAVFLLSVIHALFGWDSTVQFTSMARALSLLLQSLLPPLLLVLLALLMRKRIIKSYPYFLHWGGYAWFVWSAFPWYGELI